MNAWVQRHQLLTFFVLAFAFTWALLPSAGLSIPISLLALTGPAVAALATAVLSGRGELSDLRLRVTMWRVPARWYAVALLLPLLVTALRTAIETFSGVVGPVELQPIAFLSMVVFVLVAGEEIGWRGFALPRLQARYGPWRASAIIGFLWAVWHFPLFLMPGMPQYGTPFFSYVPYLIALSTIMTVLAMQTRGSVIIATLFHGSVNTIGIVNDGANAIERGWSNAASYSIAAIVIVALMWKSSRHATVTVRPLATANTDPEGVTR
jgi:membrane protease YdiL (CAAX protease family)